VIICTKITATLILLLPSLSLQAMQELQGCFIKFTDTRDISDKDKYKIKIK